MATLDTELAYMIAEITTVDVMIFLLVTFDPPKSAVILASAYSVPRHILCVTFKVESIIYHDAHIFKSVGRMYDMVPDSYFIYFQDFSAAYYHCLCFMCVCMCVCVYTKALYHRHQTNSYIYFSNLFFLTSWNIFGNVLTSVPNCNDCKIIIEIKKSLFVMMTLLLSDLYYFNRRSVDSVTAEYGFSCDHFQMHVWNSKNVPIRFSHMR